MQVLVNLNQQNSIRYLTAVMLNTYVFHEFLYHPIPLAFIILKPILSILHQVDLVGKTQNAGQLLKQVNTEALKAVIADECLVRLLKHDIWLLLYKHKISNEKQLQMS